MTDQQFGILLNAVQTLIVATEKNSVLLEDVLNLFKKYEVDESLLHNTQGG
jgi:hypothetical protein